MKIVAAALSAVTALVLVGVVAEGAGNEPETVATAPVSVNDSVTTGTNHFTYTGNWVPCTGCQPSGAYQNDFRYAYATGDRYVFTFTGTQVKLFAAKEPAGGVASVSFDGGPPVDVNQYAGSAVITNIWSSPQVPLGAHTVTVTVTGRKAGGSSPTVTIDRADVYTDNPPPTTSATPTSTSTVAPPTTTVAAPAVATVDDGTTSGTNSFTYTGAWVNCTGCQPTGAYQGGFRYAYTTGDKYVFRFTGTAVNLFGVKEPAGGIASVSLDGAAPVDVNQYAATKSVTNIWSSPTVPLGAHTVTVTVTGRTAGGSSPTITIDRADVITDAPVSSSSSVAPSSSDTPSSTESSPTESSSVDPGSTEPETTTTQPTDTTTSPAPTTDTTSPAPVGQPAITRNGNQLLRNGQLWKFAGLNADTWFGCWDGELGRTTDANLDRYFGELNPHSLTRIFAYANAPWQATLPRIMAAAARHGQYLMVTLSDDNGNGTQCGSNKGTGYPADGGAVTAHATAVATMAAGHPEVAIFEAINEGDHDLIDRPWYQSIARAVKAADPGVLFATGAFTCYGDISGCWQVEDFPENDLVSIHEYDWNGGAVSHWASNAQAIAAKVGKPWFAGEDGFCCGGGPGGQTETTVANQLTQEWSAYLNAPGCAGMLYWDFKWAYPDVSTINFGDPAWTAASTFRHQWQGP